MQRLSKHHVQLTCIIGLNLLFLLLARQAFSQDSQTILAVDERSISVHVPERAVRDDNATLAVELDGYDVSAFSRIDGNVLLIRLETPLAQGNHSLSVSLFMADGEIESLVYQDVYIEGSTEPESDWRFNTTFDSSHLVDHDKNHSDRTPTTTSSNGALEFDGNQQLGDWTLSAGAQAIYDSANENNPDMESWSLPTYHLTSTYQRSGVATSIGVGNILIERESLLFSSFQRRGAAVNVVTDSDRYQMQVFNVQSEPSTRIDRELITSNNTDKQILGLISSVNLPDQRLKLSVGYIDGETTLGGVGSSSFDDPTVYGGDSWNVALDSIWMNKSLWLHLEHAVSTFDSDGIGIGAEEQRDSADQIVLQLSSDGDIGEGWFDYWSGSLQYKSVGSAFYSLGNLYLPGDSKLTRMLFQGARGGLSFETQLAREQSNTDHNDFLPTQTHDNTGFTINYTPMDLNLDSQLWRLLGSPSLMSRFYRTYHHQPYADSLVVGYDLDNRVDESELNLKFNHTSWNWGLQYQLIDQDERSQTISEGGFLLYQPPSDQRNELIGLQLGWMPSERASLNMLMQWNERYEVDFDNTYLSRNLGLDAFLQLVPETLTLQLNFNYSSDQSNLSDELSPEADFISKTGNTQLTWHALKATGSRPTLDFYFRGSYGKQDNRTFALVDEQWSAHIGFNMNWAAGGQK